MKSKASTFLKDVFSVITSIVKAKAMAVKNKTSSIKTRLLVLGLLRNKKVLMSAISHKIHALMGKEGGGGGHQNDEDNSRAIVLYNADRNLQDYTETVEEEEDDGYPDLRHSLFDLDDDDEIGDGTGSAIDFVKSSREDGADFSLEDEIDLVADVFIRRFHRQMKMQKLESFKRYREMLERSV
ncbi:uncharacterized protein A4U43_C09F15370 [Asparagus officinalis]|uniref:DUF761 domain-containing protein n=1 Tax=Asparagus officinalis TaxID=4686 RepID=A0A5P1E7Q4_ASPOF|nr:uncharacterized protein LOC109824413 [Asparagus officinalis]ONK58661.1 uncharacterized protein A4U43_C09F15370 [Asparagus officinalis]